MHTSDPIVDPPTIFNNHEGLAETNLIFKKTANKLGENKENETIEWYQIWLFQ